MLIDIISLYATLQGKKNQTIDEQQNFAYRTNSFCNNHLDKILQYLSALEQKKLYNESKDLRLLAETMNIIGDIAKIFGENSINYLKNHSNFIINVYNVSTRIIAELQRHYHSEQIENLQQSLHYFNYTA